MSRGDDPGSGDGHSVESVALEDDRDTLAAPNAGAANGISRVCGL
jgi:hypothetical protein